MVTSFWGERGLHGHLVVIFSASSRFWNLDSLIIYIVFISYFVSLANFPLVFPLVSISAPFPLPNPFIFLKFYILSFFFLPGKLSIGAILFFPSPNTNPLIFLVFYILFILFFPGKLSIRVILFMALSPPNPIIFLPVFGGREFYMLTSG